MGQREKERMKATKGHRMTTTCKTLPQMSSDFIKEENVLSFYDTLTHYRNDLSVKIPCPQV